MKFEDITTETLEQMLKSTEHDFVERKSKSDKGDWLEAAVAFANSAPIGYPAVLFVGADDDGNPQIQQQAEVENLTKSVSAILDKAFPAIYRHVVPLHLASGHCLAVIVPGSDKRPHFAGPSFVRVGTETKRASDNQFEQLIAHRNSKARKILEYAGKNVTLKRNFRDLSGAQQRPELYTTVVDCNQFFVRLGPGNGTVTVAIPLERIEISFDISKDTLELIEAPPS